MRDKYNSRRRFGKNTKNYLQRKAKINQLNLDQKKKERSDLIEEREKLIKLLIKLEAERIKEKPTDIRELFSDILKINGLLNFLSNLKKILEEVFKLH